jgi:hypothetical protein
MGNKNSNNSMLATDIEKIFNALRAPFLIFVLSM